MIKHKKLIAIAITIIVVAVPMVLGDLMLYPLLTDTEPPFPLIFVHALGAILGGSLIFSVAVLVYLIYDMIRMNL